MSSSRYEPAVSFNLGQAFPADNPEATFIVALSLAYKDLRYVNMRLAGADDRGPARRAVSGGELLYLVGVAFGHLYELRTCVSQAREKWPKVATFLDGLSADTRDDLRQVLDLNTAEDDWMESALGYLRHQTFHYGATSNWKDVRWALRKVSTEEGVISKANDTYAGTRLDFAELVWVQHLTRKFPPGDPNAHDDAQQALEERQIRTLVEAVTTAISAAIRFAMAALVSYLDGLPDGVVTWEP